MACWMIGIVTAFSRSSVMILLMTILSPWLMTILSSWLMTMSAISEAVYAKSGIG